MKIVLNQVDCEENEIIINYMYMNEEIQGIIEYINHENHKITGTVDGISYMISLKEILYVETVDSNTYAYTRDKVMKIYYSLNEFQIQYKKSGYFRCSKSMVINIMKIDALKSKSGNRIEAMMNNGEYVMISRRYAKELRGILKNGGKL